MRRIALILVALMISAPVLTAQQTSPGFEVASVKPNTGADLGITFGPTPAEGINLINRPLESVVRYAFGVQPFRLLGLPAWTFDERFDINARASQAISDDDRKAMTNGCAGAKTSSRLWRCGGLRRRRQRESGSRSVEHAGYAFGPIGGGDAVQSRWQCREQ